MAVVIFYTAFAFMILLAFFAAGACLLEYRRAEYRFLLPVAAAMAAFGLWHLSNMYLTSLETIPAIDYVWSNSLALIATCALLKAEFAQANRRGNRWLTGFAAAFALACVAALVSQNGDTPTLLGFCVLAPLVATLSLAWRRRIGWSRAVAVLLYVGVLWSYGYGVLLLFPENEDLGSSYYFLLAVLVPGIGFFHYNEALNHAREAYNASVEARRELERQLYEAQRQQSLGTMAAGIAHDFNNILQAVIGNAEWLLTEPTATPDRRREGLEAILESSERASALSQRLLQYTGRDPSERERVEITSLVRSLVRKAEQAERSRVDIRLAFDVDSGPVHVLGDEGQIRQVVASILLNAVESIGDRGRVNVGVRVGDLAAVSAEAGASTIVASQTLGSGPFVLIDIQDQGAGMDAQTLEHIFDPFFTTKELGQGLGLAAVSGIVTSHGGRILVESNAGEGSRFEIALPCG